MTYCSFLHALLAPHLPMNNVQDTRWTGYLHPFSPIQNTCTKWTAARTLRNKGYIGHRIQLLTPCLKCKTLWKLERYSIWMCADLFHIMLKWVWICHMAYLRCLLHVSWCVASRVLTNPNSCITLSSWRRSSWPFNRYMNSAPLLPEEKQYS